MRCGSLLRGGGYLFQIVNLKKEVLLLNVRRLEGFVYCSVCGGVWLFVNLFFSL